MFNRVTKMVIRIFGELLLAYSNKRNIFMTGYFVTPVVVGIDTNDDYLVGIDIKF